MNDARKRLGTRGVSVRFGEWLQVSACALRQHGRRARIEQGFEIIGVKVPNDRVNAYWFYIPGVLIIVFVWLLQGLRMRRTSPAAVPA